ncbi:MAG TPA: potassium transporter Kup [Gammaproteobacteria bacterium]|nr:potassium transporter Kup [Gammaproteobacteria bacterium]
MTDTRSVPRARSGTASADTAGWRKRIALSLAVLGVVYGDIGTSMLYSLRACFEGANPVPVNPVDVLGVLSLIFWTLILVISLKYMTFVLRADNRGEGGIFALIGLLRPWRGLERRGRRWLLIMSGLFGAALLYGGIMITPAISILSAVEGLEVAAPALASYVIPLTIIILLLLFVFQRHGTARVGAVFGPVMAVWFVTIAALGLNAILREPTVLVAVNPWYAIRFFRHAGWAAFLVLYAVFLVTTGGEALYADMGHFGRGPIRRAWFGFVLPAVLLNYFGQGALLLTDPGITQPFYHLVPQWGLYPLVVLTTAATVIASQATISGSFSLTRQAIQLGQMPRFRVVQTSPETRGQIYVPAVNWVLMIAAIGLVIAFQSSANLAAAYGIAVNGTMVVTTILAYNVARERGGWSQAAALAFLVGFLAIDLTFFGSNLTKLADGGWFPVAIGIVFFTLMSTWRRGGAMLQSQAGKNAEKLETFLGELAQSKLQRVPGTAVFLTGRLTETPPALRHHIERNRALHDQVILLTVLTADEPRVPADERIEVKFYPQGFYRVILHYGYMQGPNIPSELAACRARGIDIDLDEITYYIGRQSPLVGRKKGGMPTWRDHLFAFMVRNSMKATAYYQIPADQTVEMGLQVRI